MKKMFILVVLLMLICSNAYARSRRYRSPQMAPDGSWVGGKPQMAPDGSWVSNNPQMAPDGSWVGGTPQMAPDGSWVGVDD